MFSIIIKKEESHFLKKYNGSFLLKRNEKYLRLKKKLSCANKSKALVRILKFIVCRKTTLIRFRYKELIMYKAFQIYDIKKITSARGGSCFTYVLLIRIFRG